jgi:hypothetical protein
VGFDNDDLSIFDRLTAFFQASPLPVLSIGVLTAPRATDLYRRLERENRLTGDIWDATAGSPLATNIVPLGMGRQELLGGVADLCRSAYSPAQFEQRVLNLIDAFSPLAARTGKKSASPDRLRLFFSSLQKISALGPEEAAMVSRLLRAAGRKPAVLSAVAYFLSLYGQARYFIDAFAMEKCDALPSEPARYAARH